MSEKKFSGFVKFCSLVLKKIATMPGRVFRSGLRYYFQFDNWHVIPLTSRKYATDLINYLNSKPLGSRNSVAEIGCGLGDIIRHLRYVQKTGYDMEANVLNAAAFLSRFSFNGKTDYRLFTFPSSSLTGSLDTIIMVNWIHHVPPDILKSKIEEYFDNHLNGGGEIIIDTVQNANYKVNHSVEYLTSNLKCVVNKIGDDINNRQVFAIQKIK